MPEAPEVKMMSEFCNSFSGKTKIASLQVLPISRWKDISFHVGDPAISLPLLDFKFTAHGKEIALDLFKENNDHYKRIIFQMGMSGNWIFCDETSWNEIPSIKNNTVFRILLQKDTREGFLILHDSRRFAKWFESKIPIWGAKRGPCPYNERESFVENVVLSLDKKIFAKPIYEVLLNQSYFNGVGNWIRSVLVYRTDNDWNMSAREYIKKNGNLLFENLFAILDEAYENYKDDHFPVDFFYPYGTGSSFFDSKKRRFWYHED